MRQLYIISEIFANFNFMCEINLIFHVRVRKKTKKDIYYPFDDNSAFLLMLLSNYNKYLFSFSFCHIQSSSI